MPRRGENIYKRKDGRWEGRYRVGNQCDGKPKYRSVYGRNYRDVKEKLSVLRLKPVSNSTTCRKTVSTLFSEWTAAIQSRVKSSTLANYQMKMKKHILPAFGKTAFHMITVTEVQSFINQKISEGLSEKYVSDIIIVFKSMAKYMSRIHGFQNPLEYVALPKYRQQQKRLLSEAEQQQLRSYLCNHLNETSLCILLTYYTGMRVGEVCGLRYGDIDFEKRLITVKRTVQRVQGGIDGRKTRLIVDSPKSSTSQRVIPIPESLYPLIARFRTKPECYLLSGTTTLTEPRTLQHRFTSILKKAHLPSVSYHCLRHMFATNCLQAGVDVKTLSELLGHKAVETTLNLYVHSSHERKIACMEMLRQKVLLPSEIWSA